MKRKKLFGTLIACGLFLSLFFWCIGSATAVVKLQVWYKGSVEQNKWMEQSLLEYSKVNPNVKVEMVLSPARKEAIAAAIAGGIAQDILVYNHNVVWRWGEE